MEPSSVSNSRPWWMTVWAFICSIAFLHSVLRDLFFPETRGVEVWLGFEIRGWGAILTAPVHWAIFGIGAWAFWTRRLWVVPWAAAYVFYVAISHLIWSEASPNGRGWPIGLAQAIGLSIVGFSLLRAGTRPAARRSERTVASEATEWRLDDTAAEYFEAHFVPAIFAAWAPILADAGGATEGQRVLDVACGTGIVARVVADRLAGVGQVTGLDLNPSMIKVARRLRPEVDWREGDATSMPFPDASFDVVLCQAGLMFFPEPVAALREMRRVLHPSGRLAVQVWGASQGYDVAAEILEGAAGKEVADIFRAPFTMAQPTYVLELLTKAGFESPDLNTYEEPARFPSIEAFVKTEIDGWVLKGRVDVDALLPIAREKLKPYVGAEGNVAIPMAGHVITCSKH